MIKHLTSGFIALFVLALIFSLGPTVKSALAAPCCGEVWQYASWGRAWAHVYNPFEVYGEIDDTLTDGHCVYISERAWDGPTSSWPGHMVAGSQSCGPQISYNTSQDGYNGPPAGIRMYRTGTGNYLTLFGN